MRKHDNLVKISRTCQNVVKYRFLAEEFPATASTKIQSYKQREMAQGAVC